MLTVTLLMCVVLVTRVHGYSSGAPTFKCGNSSDMVPAHSPASSSTTDMPFTLTAGNPNAAQGEPITMSITSSGGTNFKGFFVQAISDDTSTLVGTMVPSSSDSKTLTCDGQEDSALTHVSNVEKGSVTFQWVAPSDYTGIVTFYVTMVQDYMTFWSKSPAASVTVGTAGGDQTTDPTTPDTSDPVTNTPQAQTTFVSSSTSSPLTSPTVTKESPPTTQFYDETTKNLVPSKGGKIKYDPECGASKGCFVDCKDGDCNFMVTWRDIGIGVQFELYGKPDPNFQSSWVAVGFSRDTRMGDDSVTECVYNNGRVQVFNSYNNGYNNRRLMQPQIGLTATSGSYYDGVLGCTFVRAKRVPSTPEIFDLEQDWNIMFAKGRALSIPAWSISMHSVAELPPVSSASVDYQSFAVIGSGASFPLVKAHGCLMIFAWVLFTGVGLVMARYYKNVWADKTFLKLKIWFQIHRGCMAAAVGLDLVAFVIIFIDVGGYSEIPDIPNKAYLKSHPVLGIIVTALCLANPIMAFFRPAGDGKYRPFFNRAHWGVGMSAYILSAICICFGFQLGKSSTPEYAVYIMIAYVFYIVIFDIVFEVMECFSKKTNKTKIDNLEMTNTNGTTDTSKANGGAPNKHSMKKSDKLKTVAIALHIAVTGAFALVLVLIVALN